MRKTLIVLASGVIAAGLIAAFFVLQYGPTGRYQVSQVLLEPTTLTQLNYNDFDPKTGQNDRFVFDKVEIAYKGERKQQLALETYTHLYALLKNDKSLVNQDFPSDIVPDLKLSIYVRTESSASWQAATKLFQEVDFFAAGDYYRILLHESEQGKQWVHFQHPGFFQNINHALKEK